MTVMKYGWDIILVSLVSSAYVLAADVAPVMKTVVLSETRGVIYELGSKRKKPLFNVRVTQEQVGDDTRVWRTAYLELDGKPATEEEIYVVEGKIRRYLAHEHQIGVEGEAEIRGGKIFYRHGKPGHQRSSVEELPKDLAFGPLLVPMIQKEWKRILDGEEIHVDLGVLERMESYNFRFYRTREHQARGRDAVVVKMEPSSFIVRRFVDPMYLVFAPDGSKVYELIGRSVPKIQDGKGEWQALDGEAVFE